MHKIILEPYTREIGTELFFSNPFRRLQNKTQVFPHPESTFLIVVGGDSMHPYYQKNDVLIIRTDLTPMHNDDIIVSVNKTDYTLKRFDKLNNKLVALNPKYNDCVQVKEDDDVLILGVVAVLVREKCNRI